MNAVIYNPLEEYESKFKKNHLDNTNNLFDEFAKKSNINIEENKATVKEYNTNKEHSIKIKRKLNWFRFFRKLMIITIILLPFVFMKMTPKIETGVELKLCTQL